MLEGRFAQDTAILACSATTSFAGLALTVLPWLLVGGTLALHHPFDPDGFAAQCNDERCDTRGRAGPAGAAAGRSGLLDPRTASSRSWRCGARPSGSAGSAAWRSPTIALCRRAGIRRDRPVGRAPRAERQARPDRRSVRCTAPRGAQGAAVVAEVVRTEAGTVALRGPMVPRHPYPPGVERSGVPYFKIAPNGLVDTGYTCRVDRDTRAMIVTGPPAGLVSVGGYRFVLSDLQDMVGADRRRRRRWRALPDALAGHRLAGKATDVEAVQEALAELGVNPLIVRAFRDRRSLPAV